MGRISALILVATWVAVLGACAPKEEAPAPTPEPVTEAEAVVEEVEPIVAVAVLQPRADSTVSGTVTFTQIEGGVAVAVEIAGSTPGLHGIHLHEIGDCSADDFTTTGGHFNLTGAPHGGPTDAARHSGDFGNIEVGEDGTGSLMLESDMLSVDRGENTVVGRAVILHDGEDDLVSQPTGAAGARSACGVVMLEGEMEMAPMSETAASEEELGEGVDSPDAVE